jgi:Flp pilus assembly protein TadG
MKALIKILKKSEKGSMAIEFALVFPIVLLFSFGFFEFCRAVFIQNVIDYSTAQAARHAMISFDDATDESAYLAAKEVEIKGVGNSALSLIDSSKVSSFDVTIGALDLANGTRNVTIEINYGFSTYMPLMTGLTYTITSKSEAFLAQGFTNTP